MPSRGFEHRGGARIEQTGHNQLVHATVEALKAGTNFAHVLPFENLRGLVRAPRQLDRAGAIHGHWRTQGTVHKDSHLSEFPKGIRL